MEISHMASTNFSYISTVFGFPLRFEPGFSSASMRAASSLLRKVPSGMRSTAKPKSRKAEKKCSSATALYGLHAPGYRDQAC